VKLDPRLLQSNRAFSPRRQRRAAQQRAARAAGGASPLWLGLAGLGLLGALAALLFHILAFARSLDRLPPGLLAGGVPVEGLTVAEAEARLQQVYLSPVALDYRGRLILLDPAEVNFHINTAGMLAHAPAWELSGSAWEEFWAYLWNHKPPAPAPIALQAGYDVERLGIFLADVAARYDDPGQASRADPDTLGFVRGSAGSAMDRAEALALVQAALLAPEGAARRVTLPVQEFEHAPLTFDLLADLLYADVRLFQFDGTLSIFVADLQTGETLSLATQDMRPYDAIEPGMAYSGMSTIKIPVAVTYFRFREGELSGDEELLLGGVFAESANAYTDLILGLIGGGNGLRGADIVSATMGDLGLPNTYLSGLLDTLGAVTGPRSTPANSRADLNLFPDPYNQTTAQDMGRLLVMLYECSQGKGPLLENFAGEYTAEECSHLIDLMGGNEVGPIFIGGGSPEARVAHKHGWDLLPLNNVGDAALVYTPGGNYAMAVYANREEPVGFEYANRLLISLARGVYNYFNQE
jgi:hypothetical protein